MPVKSWTGASNQVTPVAQMAHRRSQDAHPSRLIINADDWGNDRHTTEVIHDCIRCEAISSVSAMVFMQDSERAAGVARESGIDAGLHLNFTTPFSAPDCPRKLVERQGELAAYLRRHSLAQAMFHPGLTSSFEYVVAAQLEEYARLYGANPRRIDGHHHMHLCANVLLKGLLPAGTIVRRNFSVQPGQSFADRLYRRAVDRLLARRHRIVDFFFFLEPLEPSQRLQRIFSFAAHAVIEVETHPANEHEYRFLASGEIFRHTGKIAIASGFDVDE